MLIGDAGEHFTCERLNAAVRLLMDGTPLLAIAKNRHFHDDSGLVLDMGLFVAAGADRQVHCGRREGSGWLGSGVR